MALVSWVLSGSRTPESVAPVRSSGVPSVRTQVICCPGRNARLRHQQWAWGARPLCGPRAVARELRHYGELLCVGEQNGRGRRRTEE